MNDKMSKYVSVKFAAQHLMRSQYTIYTWARRNKIRHVKLDGIGTVRIERAHLEEIKQFIEGE